MADQDNTRLPKPSWTERWNARSAVDKRLNQDSVKKKLLGTVLFFMFAPFVGGALIMFGQGNWLWIPGAFIMIIGVLGWLIGPFVIGGGIIYTVFSAMKPDVQTTFDKSSTPSTLAGVDAQTDAALQPILAGLSTLQADLAARRRSALAKGMPVIAAIAIFLCYLIITSSDSFNLIPIALVLTLPLFLGMHFISAPFQAQFRERFKAEVLPSLLERHGDWRRRDDYAIDLSGAAGVSVVPTHKTIQVDDAFIGTHRDTPVEIVDLLLHNPPPPNTRKSGARKTQHRVLLINLTLDRPVPATTAVIDSKRDKSWFSGTGGLQPVELEDVVFGSVYQVYSTDQIGARALLTPAVMRRLIEVADGRDFMPPALFAQGNRLQIFLSTYNERDLFEPGTVAIADMGAHVRTIDRDLANAFAIADTVIDMAAGLAIKPLAHDP